MHKISLMKAISHFLFFRLLQSGTLYEIYRLALEHSGMAGHRDTSNKLPMKWILGCFYVVVSKLQFKEFGNKSELDIQFSMGNFHSLFNPSPFEK